MNCNTLAAGRCNGSTAKKSMLKNQSGLQSSMFVLKTKAVCTLRADRLLYNGRRLWSLFAMKLQRNINTKKSPQIARLVGYTLQPGVPDVMYSLLAVQSVVSSHSSNRRKYL